MRFLLPLALLATCRAAEDRRRVPGDSIFIPIADMILAPEEVPQSRRRLGDGQQFLPGLNVYEYLNQNNQLPDCGTPGQNECFQGCGNRDDLYNNKGECEKINICHGNAGQHGWNAITVDRSSLATDANGNGHANYEHNYSNQKNPDYFPNSYSVPNTNGAGANNVLVIQGSDGNGGIKCGLVDLDATDAPTTAPPANQCTDPKPKPKNPNKKCYPLMTEGDVNMGACCVEVVGQQIKATIEHSNESYTMVNSQMCNEAIKNGANPEFEFACNCNFVDLTKSEWVIDIPNKCGTTQDEYLVHLIAKAEVQGIGQNQIIEAFGLDHTLRDPSFLSYIFMEMECGC